MAFLPILQEIVRSVEGALACSVMGFDGIAVESFQVDGASDMELQSTLVEYAAILAQAATRSASPRRGSTPSCNPFPIRLGSG